WAQAIALKLPESREPRAGYNGTVVPRGQTRRPGDCGNTEGFARDSTAGIGPPARLTVRPSKATSLNSCLLPLHGLVRPGHTRSVVGDADVTLRAEHDDSAVSVQSLH